MSWLTMLMNRSTVVKITISARKNFSDYSIAYNLWIVRINLYYLKKLNGTPRIVNPGVVWLYVNPCIM